MCYYKNAKRVTILKLIFSFPDLIYIKEMSL